MDVKQAAATTAEKLQSSNFPDIAEAEYLQLLFWKSDMQFRREVVKLIGASTLRKQLELKMKKWVPHALEMLCTEWESVDTWTTMLLRAHDAYPESIGKMFTLPELAQTRRIAHMRVGSDAVLHSQCEDPLLSQQKKAIGIALFAGVSRRLLGDPSTALYNEALAELLPEHVTATGFVGETLRASRKATLAQIITLNDILNPLLTQEA